MKLEEIVGGDGEYSRKRSALAAFAENSLPYPTLSAEALNYLKSGAICDLNEGHAPYRPRYILPDYSVLMKTGSNYLDLEAPKDFYEAIDALLIAYSHVPSITGYPVYLGDVDELLEPFVPTVAEGERRRLLRLFLTHIDRSFPDAFVHMDIGPRATVVGRDILELSAELKRAVPNISMRFSDATSAEFASIAASTALAIGKPYFVNHDALSREVGSDYAVASCYNTLRRGGGSHTLVRLSLKKIAVESLSVADFLEAKLPSAIRYLAEIINARARFVVEKSRFFDTSFLVKEGWVSLSKFTSMAGIFGLYEAVEELLKGAKMGQDAAADELALRIVEKARSLVKAEQGAYCEGFGGKFGFHAQSGIDSDEAVTPGVRIRYGEEAPLARQLGLEGRLHAFFDAGVSEICVFDRSAKANPSGIVTIAHGAMRAGIKIFSIISGDSDLVRITGYLVKRQDLDRLKSGETLREGTVSLAADSIDGGGVLKRKLRSLP